MKILHIAMGSPEIDRAAVDLGHEVRRIAWRDILGRKPTPRDAERLQSTIVDMATEFLPDLVFIQTHQSEVVHPQTLFDMRSLGAFVVFWVGDVREPLPEYYLRIAPHVDVMAFSNLTDVELMRGAGFRSEYLQIGYDPDIYNPGDGTQSRRGIVFLGNNYGDQFPNGPLRLQVLERMRNEFGRLMTIRGARWPWPNTNPTTPEEEVELYRGAQIALNIDHFTRPGFWSDRLLRAMACGCMVVDVGARCTDPTPQDAVDCVRAMLGQDRIVMAGKTNAQWALEHHTWRSRIRTMENWVNGIPDNGKTGPILAEQ